MPHIISERLEEIGMTTNQLSCLSGVRNSHLNQIKNHNIKRPGRTVLIKIALGLSWGVDGINRLLQEYGESELYAPLDFAHFMEAIKARSTNSGYNAINPGKFNFEMVIMSVEKLMGDIKLVTPVPHVVFRDFEDYFSTDQVPLKEKKDEAYKSIRELLFNERIRMFDQNIKEHKVTHLVCRKCFESYVKDQKEKMSNDGIVKEFNKIFKGMRHENYDFKLINTCPSFKFHIREPNDENEKSIVVFAGTPRHPPSPCMSDDRENIGALIGFISNAKELNEYFKIEFERLSRFATEESTDKKDLISFMISFLEKNGIKVNLE
ncbi:DNA-binding domain-containing protein [Desulfonema limicola]|uniref:DNA-binding domain-containing protein n=1 Tax=Desulfonema limicola TaxID=45656 RepID=A0A975BAG6_9BACT|nr:hypothetical protein [Desulfonema limicola]QTA81803.1 DNA-binding domain-containing protein [Desulfonema limicola]